MTEQEWLTSTDPNKMLLFLKGKDSDRKMRLFASGCCRRVWDRLTDQRSRDAIQVAERYADGDATDAERENARRAAKAAMFESDRGADGDSAWALRGELVALTVADHVSAYLLRWLFNGGVQRKNPTGKAARMGHKHNCFVTSLVRYRSGL